MERKKIVLVKTDIIAVIIRSRLTAVMSWMIIYLYRCRDVENITFLRYFFGYSVCYSYAVSQVYDSPSKRKSEECSNFDGKTNCDCSAYESDCIHDCRCFWWKISNWYSIGYSNFGYFTVFTGQLIASSISEITTHSLNRLFERELYEIKSCLVLRYIRSRVNYYYLGYFLFIYWTWH